MMYFLIWYYELRPSLKWKQLAFRMKGMADRRKVNRQLEKLELQKPKFQPSNPPYTMSNELKYFEQWNNKWKPVSEAYWKMSLAFLFLRSYWRKELMVQTHNAVWIIKKKPTQ